MNALKYVDSNMDNLILDLQILIRQPSVSAKNEGIEKCAKLVQKLLKKSGINSEILRLKKGIAPIVYGEIKSKQNPKKKPCYFIITMMSNQLNHLIYGMILHLVELQDYLLKIEILWNRQQLPLSLMG